MSLPSLALNSAVGSGVNASVAHPGTASNGTVFCILYTYKSLLASARRSKCVLISDLFSECAQSAYTAPGYSNLFGGKHLKCYTVDDELCTAFIRDACSDPHLNKHLDDDIYCISTV